MPNETSLRINMTKEEYESLDRTPTFTPIKRYNGYTMIELRARLPRNLEGRLNDQAIDCIAKLLTEPRK